MYPSLMRAGAHGAPAANCRIANAALRWAAHCIGPTMGYPIIFHTGGHSEYWKKIYCPRFQRSTSPGGLSEKLATAISKMAANSSSDNSAARSLCRGRRSAGFFEEMFRAWCPSADATDKWKSSVAASVLRGGLGCQG